MAKRRSWLPARIERLALVEEVSFGLDDRFSDSFRSDYSTIRIEILKPAGTTGKYRARVLRHFMCRLHIGFPEAESSSGSGSAWCHESIWIEDDALWDQHLVLKAKNPEAAMKKALKALRAKIESSLSP